MSARALKINGPERQGNVTVKRVLVFDRPVLLVILHSTAVVVFDADGIATLKSGGWQTVTTKTAINAALRQLGVDASVVQRKGQWYLSTSHAEFDFEDGMRVDRYGTVLS